MVDLFIWPHGSHDISYAGTGSTVLASEQGCCGVCICGTTTIPSLMVDFDALGIVCSLPGQGLDSHIGIWRRWSSWDRLWNDLGGLEGRRCCPSYTTCNAHVHRHIWAEGRCSMVVFGIRDIAILLVPVVPCGELCLIMIVEMRGKTGLVPM
jgi:hypothetical protein